MMHGSIGSPQTIADDMGDLIERGDLDGVMIIFPEYLEDQKYWSEEIQPILADRGLAPALQMS